MKKLLIVLGALMCAATFGVFQSCNSDDETTWDNYREYREANDAWLSELQTRVNPDGTPYYKMIVPSWNNGAFVLLHYFNDPAENADKLSPIYTSTVDVRYKLHLYDGTPVDSSDNVTSTGVKGVFRTRLTDVILGWPMGLEQVHCGDSVELIVPYSVGYGSQSMGDVLPYSNLRFNIRLVDIPYYEATPYE